MGRVAAGSPVLATEHIELLRALPDVFLPTGGLFSARDRDSMKEIGILTAISTVHNTSTARTGDCSGQNRG